MNFSLGFFVGGQVLAGILGSVVTYGYGAEGKHGANYMQTMAASVASTAAMAVLIQAMVWLGLPIPPTWQLIVFFTCVGMFGCGVGMLYTPILVDRMQLTYPSGYAVANILRALTDIRLLKRSIGQLGGGTVAGIVVGLQDKILPLFLKNEETLDRVAGWGISSSTIGAGMVVGARIGLAGAVVGVIGACLSSSDLHAFLFGKSTPYLVRIGWLGPDEPYRKIGFIIALGTIMGAAALDMTLIAVEFFQRLTRPAREAVEVLPSEEWKRTNTTRLYLWVAFWGLAVVIATTEFFNTPLLFVTIAIVLVFIFVMVNGISTGISDSNPISSAFVITVFILSAFGLKSPGVGLMAAAILLLSTSSGVDMQQDRSTGWRLGTNRVIQFRYQVIGIVMGAVAAVVLAKVFMKAYPALELNQFRIGKAHLPPEARKWGSAMTFKFVGALESLTHPKQAVYTALKLGLGIGFVTEVLRKVIKRNDGYKAFVASGKVGFTVDFCLDAFFLPSPYASSFGGFVELPVALWFAAGGVTTSFIQTISDLVKAQKKASPLAGTTPSAEGEGGELPEDMSATSLIGGGLIAGDSLAALGIGIWGLLTTVVP
jgi:uncharacterized oligopeptide transporter (OPT) family protein